MLSKLVFVLVIFSNIGEAQRFATFENMDQCEQFALTYNAANYGWGRAACVSETVDR